MGWYTLGGKCVDTNPVDREKLRKRFVAVIASRGYKDPEAICNQHFDEQMKDVSKFIAMLEEYEQNRD